MEAGTKMLHLDIYFKLPADFKGDLNDAIQAMLDYRRGEKNHNKDFKADPEKSHYDNWWDMVHETDRVLFGGVKLAEISEDETKPWKNLDL